jgi:hypothetical protein
MKLTLCPSCALACDACGQPVRAFAFCPHCQGRAGGSSRSARKVEAAQQNIEMARAAIRTPRRRRPRPRLRYPTAF